jgi:hypothetical protein
VVFDAEGLIVRLLVGTPQPSADFRLVLGVAGRW